MARYGMLINTKKCVGCYACRVACQMVNGLESDEAFIKFDEMEQGVYPNVYAPTAPASRLRRPALSRNAASAGTRASRATRRVVWAPASPALACLATWTIRRARSARKSLAPMPSRWRAT